MNYSEDHIALAAEYALGTLSAEERALVETMMIVDHGFMEVVDAWDRKLSPLHQMVAPVEPPPHLWDKISAELGLVGPQPVAAAEPEPVIEESRPLEPTEPDDVMMAKLLEPQEPAIAQQIEQAPAAPELPQDQPVAAVASIDSSAEPPVSAPVPEIIPEPATSSAERRSAGWAQERPPNVRLVHDGCRGIAGGGHRAAGLSARTAAGEIAGQAADPGG
jgi:type IV secretory pathway VirB10-like protein